jgi:S1-C subfamily serine protease
MRRWTGLLLLSAAVAVSGIARADDAPAHKKGLLVPQRAGWMMGMYVGEEKGQPYPFITNVDPQSDAKKRGIRPGDELIRFDGQEVNSLPRMFEHAMGMHSGKQVEVWVRRGAQTLQFQVRVPKDVGAAPAEDATPKKVKADDDKTKVKKKPVVRPVPPVTY